MTEGEAAPPVQLDPGATPPNPASDMAAAAGSAPPQGGEPPVSTEEAAAPAEPAAASEPPAPAVDDDPTGQARLCAPVAQPLLLDFTTPNNGTTQAVFGDFQSVLSGGTYVYPLTSVAPVGELQAPGLTSDVSAGDWHIAGSVAQAAGFGVFLDCQLLDASRFVGLAFRISGSIEGDRPIAFLVGSAANEVSHAWLRDNIGSNAPSFGRCAPAQAQFDGSCSPARVEVTLAAEPSEVLVPFTALTNGSPEAGATPAELTTIAWALPTPVAGDAGSVAPYAVDLRIDDIRFVEIE
jgi:hypothetical protein